MCGLCGALGADDHWSRGGESSSVLLPLVERHRQAAAANTVLRHSGLTLRVWGDRYLLQGRTGKSRLVDHLGALWAAADQLVGEAIDPLDPALIQSMELDP